MMQAATIGVARNIEGITKGLKAAHGLQGSGWTEHIDGAMGEMAFAKAVGFYWDGSVNTFRLPDVAGVQIRTRSAHNWDLIVRPGDADDEKFVLVTGRPPKFRVHGWIMGGDAKQEQWLKSYANRRPAYFVPQDALEPIETL